MNSNQAKSNPPAGEQSGPPPPAGYAAALSELETILAQLERSDVDVDALAAQVRRAGELIRYCRGCIGTARLAIEGALGDLESDDGIA